MQEAIGAPRDYETKNENIRWKHVVSLGFKTSGFESCIQQRKTTCLLSIRKSLACARASKLINNNYVYRQSQVRMPNSSGVRWAECLLIIGTGCRVQVLSLILDSSGLSAGIQSVGDWVSETLWVRILHLAEEDNLYPFDSKIACLCQSIKTNNKYIYYIYTYFFPPSNMCSLSKSCRKICVFLT